MLPALVAARHPASRQSSMNCSSISEHSMPEDGHMDIAVWSLTWDVWLARDEDGKQCIVALGDPHYVRQLAPAHIPAAQQACRASIGLMSCPLSHHGCQSQQGFWPDIKPAPHRSMPHRRQCRKQACRWHAIEVFIPPQQAARCNCKALSVSSGHKVGKIHPISN